MRPGLPEFLQYTPEEEPHPVASGRCEVIGPPGMGIYYPDGRRYDPPHIVRCFRPEGHRGDHVAHYSAIETTTNYAMARWRNDNDPGARWEIVTATEEA